MCLHSIMKSALPAKSRMEAMVISCTQVSPTSVSRTLATVQTPNFIATESAVNIIQTAENKVDIPTPTKQRNMRNPSQGPINLKGTIENGDTNGRFINNETVDGAGSGNETIQNGRARNHSVSEII